MREPFPADGHNLEIEYIVDGARSPKGKRETVSTSVARDLVAKGVAKYTGGGKSWQFEWSEQ